MLLLRFRSCVAELVSPNCQSDVPENTYSAVFCFAIRGSKENW